MNDVILLLQKIESQLCQLKEAIGVTGITTESPPVAPPGPGDPIILQNPSTLETWMWDGNSWELSNVPPAVVAAGAMESLVVNISSAQILGMFVTPVQLIPAQVGKYAFPFYISLEKTVGGINYAAGGNIIVRNGAGIAIGTTNMSAADMNSGVNIIKMNSLQTGATTTTTVNSPINLLNIAAAFTTGNGTLRVKIFYKMITV